MLISLTDESLESLLGDVLHWDLTSNHGTGLDFTCFRGARCQQKPKTSQKNEGIRNRANNHTRNNSINHSLKITVIENSSTCDVLLIKHNSKSINNRLVLPQRDNNRCAAYPETLHGSIKPSLYSRALKSNSRTTSIPSNGTHPCNSIHFKRIKDLCRTQGKSKLSSFLGDFNSQ